MVAFGIVTLFVAVLLSVKAAAERSARSQCGPQCSSACFHGMCLFQGGKEDSAARTALERNTVPNVVAPATKIWPAAGVQHGVRMGFVGSHPNTEPFAPVWMPYRVQPLLQRSRRTASGTEEGLPVNLQGAKLTEKASQERAATGRRTAVQEREDLDSAVLAESALREKDRENADLRRDLGSAEMAQSALSDKVALLQRKLDLWRRTGKRIEERQAHVLHAMSRFGQAKELGRAPAQSFALSALGAREVAPQMVAAWAPVVPTATVESAAEMTGVVHHAQPIGLWDEFVYVMNLLVMRPKSPAIATH